MDREDILRKTPTSSISSPCLNYTPKRTLLQHINDSPLDTIKESVETKDENKATPVITNPFDVNAEAFYLPSCSPSVFATFCRNKVKDNSTFQWNIEHLSVLFPADIDETSIPDSWEDPDQEMKAQKAIDTFFSQNSIVPSPWSPNSPSEGGGKIKLRRTIRKGSQIYSVASTDVSTQTKLTIPPKVDLMEILGQYFTHQEENDSDCSSSDSSFKESDVMSTSTLRRKLFVADLETDSPKWCQNKDLSTDKQWFTPNLQMRSTHSTPASDMLSSSPISLPNNSGCCNGLSIDTPSVSPISVPKLCNTGVRQSFRERIDEESSSSMEKSSFHSVSPPPEPMSFCTESQEAITFPSYTSEKQDTGYATGSMSSQSAITSDANSHVLSRVIPVTELMEDWGISKSDVSLVCSEFTKQNELASCSLKTWPWVPKCCSTPSASPDL